jgi:hypothetical protein
VLFFVNNFFAWKIGFDYIFEASVIPEQPQLYYMITELLPFHGLIPIDINFLEKIDQS